ncbi:hypothetical protein PRCB_15655 [Pantoea rodasii]|uniref:Uncharacterized protein n=1 Tax=Pantoea rodasii TaxID=1076549 RepID=A0A2M9WBC4_9GAMM|nr:hypothetical protein HA45_08330 [Pantoea rodasii]PJZ04841.1 hypothetical protein PRCB_15655 [Pantoea rodasii]
MRVVKKGTIVEARVALQLQGLSAALRLLRWARSPSHGCDGQFGLAWMALPERSARHDVEAEGTASAARGLPLQLQRCSGPHSGIQFQTKKAATFNRDSLCENDLS